MAKCHITAMKIDDPSIVCVRYCKQVNIVYVFHSMSHVLFLCTYMYIYIYVYVHIY